jgi:hypothetical protein
MSKKAKIDEAAPAVPENLFLTTLTQLEGGDLGRDCSEGLAKLVRAVTNHRKKGTFVLKLVLKPRGANGQVEVEGDVKVTKPTPERGSSMFFSDEHGRLLRRNPNQRELDLGDDAGEDEDEPRVVNQ